MTWRRLLSYCKASSPSSKSFAGVISSNPSKPVAKSKLIFLSFGSSTLTLTIAALPSYLCVCVCVWVAQSCLTLCDPMNSSPPGSSVHGILQARILPAAAAKSLQSCPPLCDPIDGSPPGSPVPGILQARIQEWVASSFSRGSFQHRDRSQVSCVAGRFLTVWATKEAAFLPPPS